VIFRQRRYGLDGEEIIVYKFRSMTVCEDGGSVPRRRSGDRRITPLGAFLRRTSLDELPQFINVLQGRMSIVGPRPHAVAHNELYRKLIKGYMVRHKVKPGITGWAQVNGFRGETDTVDKMQARIECDLEYLRNWSTLVAALVPAARAEANPWRLGGALGLQRDSNLYRLGDGREAGLPAERSKSDTITTVSLLAGLDQPLGRHRLHADASLRSQRYADNGMLDNQGWGFSGGFEWSAPERLSGALNLQSHRNLARFDADSTQVQNLQKNIERITQAEAVVRLGLVTRYSAELGYTHREVDYSASAYAAREYRQGTLMAGLRYRPSGALGFGLGWRHARTELPRYFAGANAADRPQRDDLDFSVQWQASGASDLTARLSASRTSYERHHRARLVGPHRPPELGVAAQRQTAQHRHAAARRRPQRRLP
jgi:hypothetical protein